MRCAISLAMVIASSTAFAAGRATVSGVTVDVPDGFEPKGDRLTSTSDRASWKFWPAEKTEDPDAWFNTSWSTIVASGRDVKEYPLHKESLRNGVTLYVAAASMADSRDNYRFLMIIAAIDKDRQVAHRTVFEAPTAERFNELRPLVSKAAQTIDLGGKAAPPPETISERREGPISLPDGAYKCQTRALAPSGSGAAFAQSILGTITISGQRYGATGQDGERSGGKFQLDAPAKRVRFNGGPLDGWVGAVEASGKFRFSGKTPQEPGDSLRVNDHLCAL
jgi:hypothetical protein